jgi:hypothetical protein
MGDEVITDIEDGTSNSKVKDYITICNDLSENTFQKISFAISG